MTRFLLNKLYIKISYTLLILNFKLLFEIEIIAEIYEIKCHLSKLLGTLFISTNTECPLNWF